MSWEESFGESRHIPRPAPKLPEVTVSCDISLAELFRPNSDLSGIDIDPELIQNILVTMGTNGERLPELYVTATNSSKLQTKDDQKRNITTYGTFRPRHKNARESTVFVGINRGNTLIKPHARQNRGAGQKLSQNRHKRMIAFRQ